MPKNQDSNMQKIIEGFTVGDLVNVLKPLIKIDTFASKIGRDDDITVLSFLLHSQQAALDLVEFFQKGYEFILDADVSASEIKTGSYLVFVELKRCRQLISQIFMLIDDLRASSGLNRDSWKFSYINSKECHALTTENLKKWVPLSPRAYRRDVVKPIQEIRRLCGLPINEKYYRDSAIEQLQHAAGIDSTSGNKH